MKKKEDEVTRWEWWQEDRVVVGKVMKNGEMINVGAISQVEDVKRQDLCGHFCDERNTPGFVPHIFSMLRWTPL